MTTLTMNQNSATMLKKLLEVVANISEMGVMRLGPKGFHLQTMDMSRICLVEIRLPSEWFESYAFEEHTTLTTSFGIMVKMLGCIEAGQRAWVRKIQEKGKDEWELELSGSSSVFTKKFKIPEYTLDEELLELPEVEADTDFCMPSGNWSKIIDELSLFGQNVKIHCGEQGTTLSPREQTEDVAMSCLIGLDDVESYEGCDEEFEVLFPLGLIKRVSAARQAACLGPNGKITVHITEERPLDLNYDLGNKGSARFIVAPRMDDD